MIIYKLNTQDIGATQTASKFDDAIQLLSFPFNPANTDYQNFKKQINADEAQLEDVDGNLMKPEEAKDFLSTLP